MPAVFVFSSGAAISGPFLFPIDSIDLSFIIEVPMLGYLLQHLLRLSNLFQRSFQVRIRKLWRRSGSLDESADCNLERSLGAARILQVLLDFVEVERTAYDLTCLG